MALCINGFLFRRLRDTVLGSVLMDIDDVQMAVKNLLETLSIYCGEDVFDDPHVGLALANFFISLAAERSTADELALRAEEFVDYLSGDAWANGDFDALKCAIGRYLIVREGERDES